MKMLIAILGFAAIVGCGPSEAEKREAWAKIDHEEAVALQRQQAENDALQVRLVELRYGHLAALKYEMCLQGERNHDPPKLKKNQEWCKQMKKRLEGEKKREESHPSW
jgi:hypothetical protein